MDQPSAMDLNFAPQLRPFYELDFAGYADTLGALLTPAGITPLSPQPQFQIRACKLRSGGLVVQVDATPYVANFEPKQRSDPAKADFLATFVRRGSGVITQNNKGLRFAAGDIVFRSTALPSQALIFEQVQVVVIKAALPRLLGAHAATGCQLTANLAPATQPLVEMAQRLLTHVFFDQEQSGTAATFFAEEALISLLASIYASNVVADTDAAERPQVDAWVALHAFITSNLADPELSIERVAESLRMSRSWIHQLFKRHGHTYGGFVRERRLQLAQEALRNPQMAHWPIKQIATQCGFQSASHFSRVFQQQFGESPAAHRERQRVLPPTAAT